MSRSGKKVGKGKYPPIGGAIDKLRETGEDKGCETGNSSGGLAARNNERFFEAEKYIHAGLPPDSEHPNANAEESNWQSRLLHEWAEKAGCIISSHEFEHFRKISEHTSEHVIYFDEVRNRAIKHTLAGQCGWVPKLENGRWTLGIAKPLDYLARWRLFNNIFGDNVQFEGVTLIAGGSMILGALANPVAVVISQQWHEAADVSQAEPDEKEVVEFMTKAGFRQLPAAFYGWHRAADGIIVLDAKPNNFIKTKEGVAPIDLLVTQVEELPE